MTRLSHIAAISTFALIALTQPAIGKAQLAPKPPAAARIDPAKGTLIANTTTLTITIGNITQTRGQILMVLFDSQEAFDRGGKPVRATAVKVTENTATATFANILHGRYGFKIVHDVNGDGKMDMNPFGMPIEPFAFSNNAVGNMGPAQWKDAAFDVAGPTTQTITFR